MLGKFTTHEYYCTNKSYPDTDESRGAQKLQNAILIFFEHYRSDEARNKYKVLENSEFRTEFKQLELHVKACWSLETCQYFNLLVRTNSVERYLSQRLYYVPKNLKFKKTYRTKMKLCAMKWNESHISNHYRNVNGSTGKEYRQNWNRNVHQKVFTKYPYQDYIEKRGRKRILTPTSEKIREELQTKKRKKNTI